MFFFSNLTVLIVNLFILIFSFFFVREIFTDFIFMKLILLNLWENFDSCVSQNIACFIIIFLRLLFIKNYEVFKIKKLSIFFCMNLIKFIFLHFSKFPLLYTSYFLIYSFNWYSPFLNIEYNLGLDKLGFLFIFLTAFLIPASLFASWKSVYYNTKYFFILFLVLELLLFNVFAALDYFFFILLLKVF